MLSADYDSFSLAKRPVLMIPKSKFNFGQINGLGLLEIKFLKIIKIKGRNMRRRQKWKLIISLEGIKMKIED